MKRKVVEECADNIAPEDDDRESEEEDVTSSDSE